MAEYKGIKGFKVQYLSADPSNPIIGQTWYNSTSKDLKYTELQAAAWATGGNLPVAKRAMYAAGTQTAALSAGGTPPSPPSAVTTSEEYNGSSWSGGGSMGTGRHSGRGAGTLTAAVIFGGSNAFTYIGDTEEYNGTSFSPSGSMSTGRVNMGNAGTQTAALAWAGNGNTAATNVTEEYNGSTWSGGGTFPSSSGAVMAGAGTLTAGLAFGYAAPGPVISGATLSYDGAAWTILPASLNNARYAGTGFGTQTAAVAVAGTDDTTTFSATEEYDGISWTSSTNLGTARTSLGGVGTRSDGLVYGGYIAPNTTSTEEWTGPGPATKTVTVS